MPADKLCSLEYSKYRVRSENGWILETTEYDQVYRLNKSKYCKIKLNKN